SIANIKRIIPDYQRIKIIIILRNPVDRAFSQYMMLKLNKWESLSFEDAISEKTINRRMAENYGPSYNYLEEGLYCYRIKAFQENFPFMKIYLYEDLCGNPTGLMDDILSFLDVAPGNNWRTHRKKVNPSGIPRIKFLHDFLIKPGGIIKSLGKTVIPPEMRRGIKDRMISLNLKRDAMRPATRALLTDYYEEEIRNLEGIIGRDLSHWLKK
ncbi:MAG: sulfotransferase, partial [Nitrospiraceae bacterium]|nr:sulfotransferase [Nitrospiraceae bacterium]